MPRDIRPRLEYPPEVDFHSQNIEYVGEVTDDGEQYKIGVVYRNIWVVENKGT